jgi:hypothetical protein
LFIPPTYFASLSRTRVSWATVATCVPSSAKTYPNARPRLLRYEWQFIS